MTKQFRRYAFVTTTVVFAVCARINAGVIYQNNVFPTGNSYEPGTTEVGDEIGLSLTDPSRYLQTFSFEYFGTNTADPTFTSFSQTVTVELKLYLNDSPTL